MVWEFPRAYRELYTWLEFTLSNRVVDIISSLKNVSKISTNLPISALLSVNLAGSIKAFQWFRYSAVKLEFFPVKIVDRFCLQLSPFTTRHQIVPTSRHFPIRLLLIFGHISFIFHWLCSRSVVQTPSLNKKLLVGVWYVEKKCLLSVFSYPNAFIFSIHLYIFDL